MKRTNLSALSLTLLSTALLLSSCGGNNIPQSPKEGDAASVDVNGVTIEMVYVAPGSFTMGATPENEGIDTFSELPTHRVTLSKGYFIGKTEVTQQLWEAVMGNNPSQIRNFNEKEDKTLPVTDVTWAQAKQFTKKLSELTGETFRLPTEAEWEYAGRGASKTFSRQYCGSQYLDQVGCFKQTSNGTPHPVGQFRPNEIGTYDMSGNVSEWVEDNFTQYKDSAQTDPCYAISDTLNHVARGGAFGSKMNQCRTATREQYAPKESYPTLGLRIVMEQKK